jgi:transcriptional regulator with XRE-family HTH domain
MVTPARPDSPGDGRDRLSELGSFIRQQRSVASLSLRRLSELAGISNPYLSQIERGLRQPSAQILQQLARALRISAETLYVQAGILEDRPPGDDLDRRILADSYLSEEQRQALVRVYWSFRHEHGEATRHATRVGEGVEPDVAPGRPAAG